MSGEGPGAGRVAREGRRALHQQWLLSLCVSGECTVIVVQVGCSNCMQANPDIATELVWADMAEDT